MRKRREAPRWRSESHLQWFAATRRHLEAAKALSSSPKVLQKIRIPSIDAQVIVLKSSGGTLDKVRLTAIMPGPIFRRTAFWLVLTVAVATLSMAGPQELPEGEGKKLLEQRCAGCHSLQPVISRKQSQSAWRELVVRMVGYGCSVERQRGQRSNRISDEVLRFREFGCGRNAGDSGGKDRQEKFIEGICTSCHDAGLILSTKATKQGWFDIITRMNGKDAGLSPRDVDLLVDYLASRYGPE